MKTRFYIKNMVCEHCAEVLKTKLEEAGFGIRALQLGELELDSTPGEEQLEQLYQVVRTNGFDIISDTGSQYVERVKHLIIDLVHGKEKLKGNLSDYLAGHTNKDYQTLSRLFSSVEG